MSQSVLKHTVTPSKKKPKQNKKNHTHMHPNNKKCREKGTHPRRSSPSAAAAADFHPQSHLDTHRNQGCQGTHMGLIQLIKQLLVKNCSKPSEDWSHCSGNVLSRWKKKDAYNWFWVFFLQNLLRLVRRKLEHGCNHFGHCLRMRSQKKNKSVYGVYFHSNNLSWKEKNKTKQKQTNSQPGCPVAWMYP